MNWLILLATLSFNLTAPTTNNLAACGDPTVSVAAADSVRIRYNVTGPAGFTAVTDTVLWTARGVANPRSFANAPFGSYSISTIVVRRSSTDGHWIPSCPAPPITLLLIDAVPPMPATITCTSCTP